MDFQTPVIQLVTGAIGGLAGGDVGGGIVLGTAIGGLAGGGVLTGIAGILKNMIGSKE